MKVLQVINSLSGGGAESFVTDLAISLSKDYGMEVSLLLYAGILDKKGEVLAQKLKNNDVKVYSLNIVENYKKIMIPYFFNQKIKEIDPDIIHSHLDQSNFFLAVTKFFYHSFEFKMVRTIHNNGVLKRLPLFVHERIFKCFDSSISCSDSVKEEYQIKKFRSQIVSIPNGIKIEKRSYHYQKEDSKIKFISIGSFTPKFGVMQKSQDLIIKAVNLIQNDNIEVHFLGDGTKLNEMKLEVDKLKLNDKIIFHGLVGNVYDYFLKGDALLFPSRFEGLPISVIEATTFGLPIITSDIAAFKPFESSSSLSSSLENITDLASKMNYMAENLSQFSNKALKNRMAFCKKFDITHVAKKYINYYNK